MNEIEKIKINGYEKELDLLYALVDKVNELIDKVAVLETSSEAIVINMS